MSLTIYQESISNARYKGEGVTAAEVLQTAALVARARKDLSDADYEQLKAASGINPKVWSKLLQIGQDDRLLRLADQLPPSYTTIHGIHCLSSHELQQALDDGAIRPTVAMAVLRRWLQEIRQDKDPEGGPGQLTPPVHGPLVTLQQGRTLTQEEWDKLRSDLEVLVSPYDIKCLYPAASTLLAVKRKCAHQRSIAIGKQLLDRLEESWKNAPEDLKSLFSINALNDLIECSLQAFTGFFMKLAGSREVFWDLYGNSYILKIALEFNRASSRAQRFNYKRRLREIEERHPKFAGMVNEIATAWMDY